jgi:drug/metabolite transporter (DMT)-like permease
MKSNIQFILSMIIFGTIGVVVRYIDLSSSETALLSSSIGCLFLMFVFFVMKKSIPWKLVKANASVLFLSGIALGGNWIFLYQSYDYTTVTNATLAYYFAPVFVMILSPIILKEQLPIKKIVCIGVAILGMLLIVGNGISTAGKGNLLGIFFGLVAPAFYAALMLLNKFIPNIHIQVRDYNHPTWNNCFTSLAICAFYGRIQYLGSIKIIHSLYNTVRDS